jgi:hypothetical protein
LLKTELRCGRHLQELNSLIDLANDLRSLIKLSHSLLAELANGATSTQNPPEKRQSRQRSDNGLRTTG